MSQVRLFLILLVFSVFMPCSLQADPIREDKSYSVVTLFVDESGSLSEENSPAEDGAPELVEFSFEVGQEAANDASYELGLEELKSLSVNMHSEEYQNMLEQGVVLPVSSSDLTKVESLLSQIEEHQIERFLQKKQKFLNTIVKLSLFLAPIKKKIPGMKPVNYLKINELLESINEDLFNKAAMLVDQNVTVYNLSLMHANGFGFSDWLMRLVKKRFKSDKIPERLGYYLYFSAGFSVYIKKGGSFFGIRITPTLEGKIASEIVAPFFLFSGGLVSTLTLQELKPKPIQRSKILTTPVTTLIQQGDLIGFTIPTLAANIIPGTAWAMALTGRVTRLSLTPGSMPEVSTYLRGLSQRALKSGSKKAVGAARICKNIIKK